MQTTIIAKQSASTIGMVVLIPNNYDSAKKYPLVIALHGGGGKGEGTQQSLANLVNNDEIPANLKKAVDVEQLIVVAPQTNASWPAAHVQQTIDYIPNLGLSLDPEMWYITGLSLGSGLFNYFLNTPGAKNPFAAAAPIAMLPFSGNWQNVVDSKAAFWFFHNLNDTSGVTPVSATNNATDAINKLAPGRATKTIFNATGHGGWGEAYDPINAPVAPNGQGLIAPAETLWQWMKRNKKGFPVAPKGKVVATELQAIAGEDRTVQTADIALKGTGSLFKSAKWETTQVPDGINKYAQIITSGGGYHEAVAKLPKEGVYVFKLTVYSGDNMSGNSASDEVVITYSKSGEVDPPIGPVFTPTHKIIRADGSSEQVRIESL